jgi:hypothetical protein
MKKKKLRYGHQYGRQIAAALRWVTEELARGNHNLFDLFNSLQIHHTFNLLEMNVLVLCSKLFKPDTRPTNFLLFA